MLRAQWATPYSDMVLSRLDFEAAGGLVVRYCLSNYLLQGH